MEQDVFQPPLDPGYYGADCLRSFGFKSVGANVRLATNCAVYGFENITIGDNVRIDAFCTIVAVRGELVIGSNVHIGGYCHLTAADRLELHDFSGLSQGVRIYTATDDYGGGGMTNPTVPPEFTNVTVKPVTLGRHVIVGSGSVILPGCDVGEGSAVGALSLVTKPLGPWGLYAGNPARRIKTRLPDTILEMEERFSLSAAR